MSSIIFARIVRRKRKGFIVEYYFIINFLMVVNIKYLTWMKNF